MYVSLQQLMRIRCVYATRPCQGLTKNVLETALDAEVSGHLGYEKHEVLGRNGANSRNGSCTNTVLTEIGPVEIEVPRDRDAPFDLQVVRKRQRRLTP